MCLKHNIIVLDLTCKNSINLMIPLCNEIKSGADVYVKTDDVRKTLTYFYYQTGCDLTLRLDNDGLFKACVYTFISSNSNK